MNILPAINIVHILTPLVIGGGFILFQVADERVRKTNLTIYCFLYFIATLFVLGTLPGDQQSSPVSLDLLGGIQMSLQKDLAKFLLLSPLGFFLQAKQALKTKDNFSINIFFQGLFFTFFNFSLYVEGVFSIYCVLEVLIFSTIILSIINDGLTEIKNTVLQGIGSALILLSLMMTSSLIESFSWNEQVVILSEGVGIINIKMIQLLTLLLGILLKSTIIEYRESEDRTPFAILLLLIKLYFPMRFLFESEALEMVNSNTFIQGGLIALCLFNCLYAMKKNSQSVVLQLGDLFSGLLILALAILGGVASEVIAKYSFTLILSLIFYIDLVVPHSSEESNDLYGVTFFILFMTALWAIFRHLPQVSIFIAHTPLLAISIITLCLSIRNIWNSIAKNFDQQFSSSDHFDSCSARSILIIAVILILTEVDIAYLSGVYP